LPSWKKQRPKVRGKKDVVDEWETMDIDRDEQERGLKRRKRRWKEIEAHNRKIRALEKKALKKAQKIKPENYRQPTPIEAAWLRCDYVLSNIMDKKAYHFMEVAREKDVKCYKYLYKIFMSRNMMEHIQDFVIFFAKGGKSEELISFPTVIKHYRKYKGIKSNIKIAHKGEEEYDL